MLCREDLEITNISVLNPNVDIAEITLGTEIGGISMDRKIETGNAIALQQGTLINPTIILHDYNFVDQFFYTTTVYIMIEYKAQGTSYATILETNFRTRPDFFEIAASLHEDINFLPYYYDYLIPVNEVMRGE